MGLSRTPLWPSGQALFTLLPCSRRKLLNGPKKRLPCMTPKAILQLPLHAPRVGIILMKGATKSRRVGQRENRKGPHGRKLTEDSSDEAGARPQTSPPAQPRVSSLTNDSYCLNRFPSRLLTGSNLTGQTMNNLQISNVNSLVVEFVPSAPGFPQRKGISPGVSDCHLNKSILKYVKGVSCVIQLSCVQPVTNVKNVALNLPVGARLQNFWQSWVDLGAGPKVVQILKEGYTLPFRIWPNLARSPTVVSCYVNPHRNSYLLEAYRQKRRRAGPQPNFSAVFQPTISSPKTKQPVETYSRSEQAESFPQDGEIQNGDTRNHQDIPPARGVGHFHRYQGCLLPYTNTGTVQKISEISCTGSDIPVQGSALWSVHSTLGSSL